ncbi:MAG: aromatic ring-hydroxylating oxygenase subunit alpha [Granulosicoccaceae bacterium]
MQTAHDKYLPFLETLHAYTQLPERRCLPPWHCLGRADEIAQTGDFFTTELLGEPLLVVRDEAETIRVLANVCRHRNMPVAEGSGRSKRFICPYHAWSYKLDGALIAAPLMENSQHACGLPSHHCEVWQGFIYTNLSPVAEPLAEQLKELDAQLANYHCEQLRHVFVTEEVWPANWKCLVENFMEGYHLSRVHPKTLGDRTPTRLCQKLPSGRAFTGYRAHYPTNAPARGKHHPDLNEEQLSGSSLYCVFPTQVFSIASDVLVYLALQPAGPDHVRLRWGMSVYDHDMPQAEIDARITLWRQINEEDKAKLGKVQAALHSQHAVAGPLAPEHYEGTIFDFIQYYCHSLAPQTELSE